MVAGGGTVTSSAGFNAAVPCGGDSSPVNAADTTAISQSRKPSDTRRSNKPIMEKRRRARINNCLNELKTLILDAMKKDPARHSKLEKADILEMTVKHLEQMQRQQVALSLAADPLVVNKFRAGFNECAGEVGRFPGLDPPVRRRLLQHLGNCLNNSLLGANGGSVPVPQDPTPGGNVQLHILPTTLKDASVTINQQHQSNGGIFLSTTNSGSLQLVPTRLPNGDIALILPSSTSNGFAHSQPKSIPSSPTPSSTSSSPPPMPLLVSLPTSKPTLINPSNAPSSSPDTFERIPKSVAYDMVSSSNYASDSSVSPTHLVNTNYGQSRKLSVDCNTDFDRISPNHEQFVNQKLVDRSSYKNYQRMSPYAKIVVDKSTFNSASNDSPSRASPTTFERLSVNIPASQNLSNDVATSPVSLQSNGSYPSPLSPSGSSTYETMSPSRCYSPPSQKPLSLVIKRESMEALDDEPCWRPW